MVDSNGSVKFVNVEIDENCLEQGAVQILKEIRPTWILSDVHFKLLTDGITNKLLQCYLNNKSKDVVLIRIYGEKTDMLIDRTAETRNIILLHKENFAPELYATFKNGLVYEFVPGITLDPTTVIQPKIYSLVAAKMAQLHLIKPEIYLNREPMIWKKLLQFYNLIPDIFSDNNKQIRFTLMENINPKSKLLKAIQEVKKSLANIENPVVFAHNDLLLGNVILNTEKNSVTFIDYEYADMNYQAFDIGNHFAEFQGIDVNSTSASCFPNKELQLNWLRIYLQVYKNTNEINEQEIQQLYIQVNQFALVAHLLWGLWALVQTEHSNIDFDYLGYGEFRLQQYFSEKQKWL